jgi:hypothetical protein
MRILKKIKQFFYKYKFHSAALKIITVTEMCVHFAFEKFTHDIMCVRIWQGC